MGQKRLRNKKRLEVNRKLDELCEAARKKAKNESVNFMTKERRDLSVPIGGRWWESLPHFSRRRQQAGQSLE
jgi:hypothetical protein